MSTKKKIEGCELVVEVGTGPSDAPTIRVGDTVRLEGGLKFRVDAWHGSEGFAYLSGPKGGSAKLWRSPKGGWRMSRGGDWTKSVVWKSAQRACPMCGAGILSASKTTETFDVSRRRFAVEVDCEACDSCGELLVSHAEMSRAHLSVASDLVKDGCAYREPMMYSRPCVDGDAVRFVLKALGLRPADFVT